jgi:hypothetical protein
MTAERKFTSICSRNLLRSQAALGDEWIHAHQRPGGRELIKLCKSAAPELTNSAEVETVHFYARGIENEKKRTAA